MPTEKPEQLMLQEMQVMLAQERTYLSILRTGVTLLASALSMLFLIIANESILKSFLGNYAHLEDYTWGLKIALAMLGFSGLWIILSSERKLTKLRRLMKKAKRNSKSLAEIMI